MNFSVQNFDVEKNITGFKPADHPFKLIFNAATLIEDINQHTIVRPPLNVKDFSEIKQGNCRPDLLIGLNFENIII
jgi:hypothetical protein